MKEINIVDDDHNSLWKNIKNDFDDFILQTRRQLNDIENEEKKFREMIEENCVKKAK